MGNTPSATHTHEPLEHGFVRGKFGDIKNAVGVLFLPVFYWHLFTYNSIFLAIKISVFVLIDLFVIYSCRRQHRSVLVNVRIKIWIDLDVHFVIPSAEERNVFQNPPNHISGKLMKKRYEQLPVPSLLSTWDV